MKTERKPSRRYGYIFVARQPNNNQFIVRYKDEYFFEELAYVLVPEFLMLDNPAGGTTCANGLAVGGSKLFGRYNSGRSKSLQW